jgi:putative membrane-bound dehydrogenase-like protein
MLRMSGIPFARREYLVICLLLGLSAVGQAQSGNPLNEPIGNPGIRPTAADGRVLNLDFETGDLTDWKAEGAAFTQQPIRGEIDKNRPFGEGKKSQHTGEYWIGGYEKLRDDPTGTLTSVSFPVTQPWASFLIGGGAHAETRVELVRADTQQVFYRISGKNQEEMVPVVVNLQSVRGKEIFIRLIDQHTGGWGHLNFDDFRFHAQQPRFRQAIHQPASVFSLTDAYPHAGLAPEEAARVMQVPPGFKVQVVAGEPEVTQPIAMAIDDRGRIWVAEAHTYPLRAEPGQGRDRIVIFEDHDLDGYFETKKIFIEGLNLVSGLEVGFGGIWVGAAPYLMFIPDRDGDDVPDAPAAVPDRSGLQFPADVPPAAVVLLDGWHWEDTHETLNSFIWGPDGWLYGCHGVFTHSVVGKPGTPAADRQPLNAGIWRYHPVRHEFEVFAHGTSNPWGVDYNAVGDFFCTACVIPHLYHIIPGARYQRQAGQHFNPHTYDDIKTIARHRHFVGNQWNNDDRARSNDLGGGHAHSGALIYQGGAWPQQYQGQLFMNNIHGNRLNVDQLIPEGSGYAGDRAPDFLLTGDQWSQMLYLTCGPDGQVYVIDWYDANQCHHGRVDGHDRSNGRIYRIAYGAAPLVRVNLAELTSAQLYREALLNENEWYVRHARRLLQERVAAGQLTPEAAKQLLFQSDPQLQVPADQPRQQVRWLSLAQVLLGPAALEELIRPAALADIQKLTPEARAYGIRLLSEVPLAPETVARRTALARAETDPRVRLAIAAALQKQPLEQRWGILEALLTHAEDAQDHNLPLMLWYAMEPLAEVAPERALALALSAGGDFPMLREFMIRRLGSGDPQRSLELLMTGLEQATTADVQLTFLRGIYGTVRGNKLQPPADWPALARRLAGSSDRTVVVLTHSVSSWLGDAAAVAQLARLATGRESAESRRQAFRTLVDLRHEVLAELIPQLVQEPELRRDALRAAAVVGTPQISQAILELYGTLTPAEKVDARNSLASRAGTAAQLLAAVEANQVPKGDLTADLIRQLRNLNDAEVQRLLERVWGVARESSADRQRQMAEYRAVIEDPRGPEPDIELGRALFSKTCQQCHQLFGTGGKVGPDITGANRGDLNYLLSNIVDPSAVMAKEYQPHILATADGRVITGIIQEETPTTISVRTTNELLTLAVSEIEERRQSEQSMMPDDQLRPLNSLELRSLFAYLQSPGQVPLKGTPATIGQFYNGTDLTGWRSTREEDAPLWTVEQGEIVGRSAGLKHNAFLMSELSLENFRFSCEVLLKGNVGNSGIQFRSTPLSDGEVQGYQADIGPGWWGKLYEERGRGLLHDREAAIRPGDWNTYEILAIGSRVRTYLNGVLCVDRTDPVAARKGLLAFQLHSGGPMEVRFRNLQLQLVDVMPPQAAAGFVPGTFPQSAGGAYAGSEIRWKKTQLDNKFRSEGVCIADFNNDGRMDIAAGSQLYLRDDTAPDGWLRVTIAEELREFDPKVYSDSFMNYAEDLNGDGYLDLIVVDFPGKQTWWFENTLGTATREGDATGSTSWPRHEITPITANESPQYLDLTGNGRRELLCGVGGNIMAYLTPQSHPQAKWKINPVSLPGAPGTERFSHGLGAGDLNGDGRHDVVITSGWWEAPPAGSDPTQPWVFHSHSFGPACSQMIVFDFDGDGDQDVLSASAHDFGIWWHEQVAADDGEPQFVQHEIDKSFSETHAVVLADINGDGLPDFVTGKRWWSHAGGGPGGDQPAVLHWFELRRDGGTAQWIRYEIDTESGVGTAFEVGDINGDGLLDIAISNKRGTFVFEQLRKE